MVAPTEMFCSFSLVILICCLFSAAVTQYFSVKDGLAAFINREGLWMLEQFGFE